MPAAATTKTPLQRNIAVISFAFKGIRSFQSIETGMQSSCSSVSLLLRTLRKFLEYIYRHVSPAEYGVSCHLMPCTRFVSTYTILQTELVTMFWMCPAHSAPGFGYTCQFLWNGRQLTVTVKNTPT